VTPYFSARSLIFDSSSTLGWPSGQGARLAANVIHAMPPEKLQALLGGRRALTAELKTAFSG